jgi:hypothetical protein
MWTLLSFALPFVFVAMVLLAVWRRQQRDLWLPPELRGATCVFVETELTTTFEGKEFVGRLDRGYEMSDASFIPLEFKTRKNFKVYDTDIAELSLQAWLLRKTGRAARYEGFVVVQHNTTRQRKCFKVPLWDDQRCQSQIQRHLAIKEQKAVAQKNKGGRCFSCGHRLTCNKL